jgi:hypothetical protein
LLVIQAESSRFRRFDISAVRLCSQLVYFGRLSWHLSEIAQITWWQKGIGPLVRCP